MHSFILRTRIDRYNEVARLYLKYVGSININVYLNSLIADTNKTTYLSDVTRSVSKLDRRYAVMLHIYAYVYWVVHEQSYQCKKSFAPLGKEKDVDKIIT